MSPVTGERLATIERASARFWGTLTLGAHATGYTRSAGGRPEALWIARRSFTKATDPGMLDNLVGGGVPHGRVLRPADTRLLDAMRASMPNACGCALGLDRLVMVTLGLESIDQAIAFAIEKA